MDILEYTGNKRIPFILQDFLVNTAGTIEDGAGNIKTLQDFNEATSLEVQDINVLVAVTFQRIRCPPAYWKSLVALIPVGGTNTPESICLGLSGPVESAEYPGYYIIPYYSNYVISKTGRLLKRSDGREIEASEGNLGYWTYRMCGDDGNTQNRLRHRILAYAFLPYPADVEFLDVNHLDGVPGNDVLENLEWATRSENISHAYRLGLRSDNTPVQVFESRARRMFIFSSYSAAARAMGITSTTVGNRARSNGYKMYDGFQFRDHPSEQPWPAIDLEEGRFLVEFPDGNVVRCSQREAAAYAGVTPTSLLRLLREGRSKGSTECVITRLPAKSS